MTDCSCIAVYVDEGYDDSGEEIRVAGVERKCVECNQQIELGEQYEHSWGANLDGDEEVEEFNTFDTCLDCASVRNAFFCEGWYYTRVWEDVAEHLHELNLQGEIPKASCMASLTKGARDAVCDLIQEEWDEMNEDEDMDDE